MLQTASAAPSKGYDELLAEAVAEYYADPLGFVLAMYPWGEPGILQNYDGPDTWQAQFLREVGNEVSEKAFDGVNAVLPIRRAISSGHGIGKSVMVAWLVDWLMSTRPHTKGVITANTSTQLETKTWAAVRTWTKRCKTGHWFEVNAARMYHKRHPESWFCTPQTCREENSEAFAGQHAADATSFYIFDEASAIPEAIYQVAEGGLTDGEPMMFLFGNPTRSQGSFYKCAFGSLRHRWTPVVVDARTAKFTNKELIREWAEDHGEESDFFRVRVLGLPPSASDLQFISTALVTAAQTREPINFGDEPLVAGLDIARGGSDDCVLRFRRGNDARSIPPIRIPGEQARDSMRVVSIAADVLGRDYGGRKVDQLFVDGTGIGGPIADRLIQLGHDNVTEIQFSWEAPDPKYANYRAYMWGKLRDWLPKGAIDKTPRLETDLTGPGYKHDKRDRVVLESKEDMKKRDLDSPDDGDALALTFAQPVKPQTRRETSQPTEMAQPTDWMGM